MPANIWWLRSPQEIEAYQFFRALLDRNQRREWDLYHGCFVEGSDGRPFWLFAMLGNNVLALKENHAYGIRWRYTAGNPNYPPIADLWAAQKLFIEADAPGLRKVGCIEPGVDTLIPGRHGLSRRAWERLPGDDDEYCWDARTAGRRFLANKVC